MNLHYTPAEEVFRAEVRDFLESSLARPEFSPLRGRGGPGDEHTCFEPRQAWERFLGAAGYIGLGWPTAYGGRDATLVEQYQRGIARRKQALGEAYVNARIEQADAFSAEFQHMITRWAWQDVWTRPVFDDRTRRLIVLAITSALARWEEFRLHAKAGLDRELSPTELKELLQQASIYAGVPTGVSGFKLASELLAERAAERAKT